jgi:hypothetical protein
MMNPDDRVLVAVMNNPRDMEIARWDHWYRIPVKHAPAGCLDVQYLAFYLTAAFGDWKWAVHEYAPVRGYELVPRCDLLPDEPEHPRVDEWYYKIELGPLAALTRPIPSRRWRRITFIVTTGDRFMAAQEINDLFADGEGEALFVTLKDAGLMPERQLVIREAGVEYEVDLAIPCQRGVVSIAIGEGAAPADVLRFDAQQVSRDAATCLAAMQDAVAERGGVLPEDAHLIG